MALRCVEEINEVWIDESVDTHDHLRDLAAHGDGRMEMSVGHALGEHGVIMSIGNNPRAVLDQATADAHIRDAYGCIPPGSDLTILAAPLMTDATTPEMVLEARLTTPRTVPFWKVFLFGVSNDAGKSVRDLRNIDAAVTASCDVRVPAPKVPIHYHVEEKYDAQGNRIEMRHREYYAMRFVIAPFIERHPGAVHVVKHVSDLRTLGLVKALRSRGYEVYAEVSAHYLCKCHEDLYEGPGGGTAFNANDLCWPIYKSAASMHALNKQVVNCGDEVFFGSDRALHLHDPTKPERVKITDEGIVCGGVAILPAVSKSIVIDRFVDAGKTENLDAYFSGNARRVHHLPPARKKVRYVREPWTVPYRLDGTGPTGEPIEALLFMRGQTMNWRRAA